MSTLDIAKANLLGHAAAEHDLEMLSVAFYETQDYRTIMGAGEPPIIVGRRGSGKSALAFRIAKEWGRQENCSVVKILVNEDQVIGLRDALLPMANSFNLIRGASRLIWRYGLMMELAVNLSEHYKVRGSEPWNYLQLSLKRWRATRVPNADTIGHLRTILRKNLDSTLSVEQQLADLAVNLDISGVQEAVTSALEIASLTCLVVIDRLDEGYQPDALGVAFICGVLNATVDATHQIKGLRTVLFLRDNIFRAVAQNDIDYTRNLEDNYLRLHWDEHELFSMVCERLRRAFSSEVESNVKLWASCVEKELRGLKGFRECLRLTLYRPRDILVLLNKAFHRAAKASRNKIARSNVESTAKEISETRLVDLIKEYEEIIPGLKYFTNSFANGRPTLAYKEVVAKLKTLPAKADVEPAARLDLEIHDEPDKILISLHGVGFLGVQNKAGGHFVFCHDGRAPIHSVSNDDLVMVHPCYWKALNLAPEALQRQEADEIFDEYDMRVLSQTPQVREKMLVTLIQQLPSIEIGREGARQFEDWCLDAVRLSFAGSLINVELKPNRNASERRDIVGTNTAVEDIWQWIREGYRVRQVVFECKNMEEFTAADFRQVLDYLSGDYGKLGFIISRSTIIEPTQTEIERIRGTHDRHQKLVIKLTADWLKKQLHRLRTPAKPYVVADALSKLVDNYTRLYLAGQGLGQAKKRKRKRSKR